MQHWCLGMAEWAVELVVCDGWWETGCGQVGSLFGLFLHFFIFQRLVHLWVTGTRRKGELVRTPKYPWYSHQVARAFPLWDHERRQHARCALTQIETLRSVDRLPSMREKGADPQND